MNDCSYVHNTLFLLFVKWWCATGHTSPIDRGSDDAPKNLVLLDIFFCIIFSIHFLSKQHHIMDDGIIEAR